MNQIENTGDITLAEYERKAAETAIYPSRLGVGGLLYTVLGLTGEAGEIANQVKKILRDDNGVLSDQRRDKIVDELGDVLWYVATTAQELRTPLEEVAKKNLAKLRARAETGTLAGDRRNEPLTKGE